jgi:hypothetical protein
VVPLGLLVGDLVRRVLANVVGGDADAEDVGVIWDVERCGWVPGGDVVLEEEEGAVVLERLLAYLDDREAGRDALVDVGNRLEPGGLDAVLGRLVHGVLPLLGAVGSVGREEPGVAVGQYEAHGLTWCARQKSGLQSHNCGPLTFWEKQGKGMPSVPVSHFINSYCSQGQCRAAPECNTALYGLVIVVLLCFILKPDA